VNVKDYYDTYWSAEGFRPTGSLTAPLRRLLENHIEPTAACLDVGCGDGRTSGVWLRDYCERYVGVDISPTAIKQARSIGLDARQINDASELPFEDESFDAAVCIEVLEHLFAPHEAAQEVARVLRPGGLLIATVPNAVYWRRRVDFAVLGRWNPLGDDRSVAEPWRDPHIRFFTRRSLARMLKHSGFDEVAIGGHGGTFLGDIPLARRACRRRGGWVTHDWAANPVYTKLEYVLPGLLGYRLHAVARKAGI
jgi:SAM-dependent methyltransferase